MTTPYARGRTVYDADSHIMETLDWLGSYAEAHVRDRLRPIMSEKYTGGPDERVTKLIDHALSGVENRRHDAGAASEAERRILETKGWAAIGAIDPAERSRSLDVLGFGAQLVFGTGAYGQYAYSDDLDVVYGGARAFNRGIQDFCSDDPRLLAVGHIPFNDPNRAAELAEECAKSELAAVCLNVGAPPEYSPSHPAFDRVYSVLADADMAFMLHLSVGTAPTGSRVVPAAFRNNGRENVPFPLGGEEMRSLDFLAVPSVPMLTLGAMVLEGVFERHPSLRGGVIEQGAMWIVPWLHWLDSTVAAFARNEPHLNDLSLKPSEYIRRQVCFTPFAGEPVDWIVEHAGAELVMFSTDYPHPEGGRDPLGRFESHLAEADDAVKEAFYSANFSRLMGSRISPIEAAPSVG